MSLTSLARAATIVAVFGLVSRFLGLVRNMVLGSFYGATGETDAFVNSLLIVGYYLWDRFWYYPQEEPKDVVRDEGQVRRLTFSGIWPNAALLVGVILTVGLLDPAKAVPGTDWHPWLYLREAVQLGLVALSLLLGNPAVRRANQFNYGAILEVAALFFGSFICMQAPLQILNQRARRWGCIRRSISSSPAGRCRSGQCPHVCRLLRNRQVAGERRTCRFARGCWWPSACGAVFGEP